MEDEELPNGPVFNVQCASSSDFVVGRQTNFNAPVTIIANGIAEDSSENSSPAPGWAGGVVLCGRLLAEDTAQAVKGPTFIQLEKATSKKEPHRTFFKGLDLKTRAWLGLPVFVWAILTVVAAGCVIAALVQIFLGSKLQKSISSEDDKHFLGNTTHQYLTRKDWGGVNATSRIEIPKPVPYVIISHTVSDFCYETETCCRIVRDMQKDTMTRTPPFADIPYSFLIGGDGNIYEGRGWNFRSAQTGLVNNMNIDMAFIGDFSLADTPTLPQVKAVQQLIEHGVMHGHLDKNYILLPNNATTRTLSPGQRVYKIIKTWDHFRERLPEPRT